MILIDNDLPKHCSECNYKCEGFMGGTYCIASRTTKYIGKYAHGKVGKPVWCPIKGEVNLTIPGFPDMTISGDITLRVYEEKPEED